jgi:hypothetical protein
MRVRKAKEKPVIENLQREREHLETLFADRINFYLVFAAGILVVLLDKPHDGPMLRFALIVVIIVSGLMLIALARTFLLVRLVLKEITEDHQEEPYSRYHETLRYVLPNANYFLLCLPIALTVFFCYALRHLWNAP